MKYKVGQICYINNGHPDFLEVTGLKLPLKCRVVDYNTKENSYDLRILESVSEPRYLEMSDGTFMRVQEKYGLSGVTPENLMGSVG